MRMMRIVIFLHVLMHNPAANLLGAATLSKALPSCRKALYISISQCNNNLGLQNCVHFLMARS